MMTPRRSDDLASGPVVRSRAGISRRRFLAGTGSLAALGWLPYEWTAARSTALRRSLTEATAPGGTTLESTVVRLPGVGYRRLTDGPGWPTQLREELAGAASGRLDRRRPIAAFVQFSDIHLTDAQSPGRVEFLDPLGEPFTAAFRPHETLCTQVASSMVARVNQLGVGPITGRRLDCVVSTGDNIDNCQTNELDWFIRLLDGGRLVPDSGQLGVYEGVQVLPGDPRWYHPAPGVDDVWKGSNGFPDVPGLLEAAITPYDTPALSVPWFSMYGNHDGLLQGNLPIGAGSPVDAFLTGARKLSDIAGGFGDFLVRLVGDPAGFVSDVAAGVHPSFDVTPDPDRRVVAPEAWVAAHLASPSAPGPTGHGYTQDHLETPELFYEFEVAPGVTGLALDTGGYYSGSIGEDQFRWLQARLEAGSSRWFDTAGVGVASGNDDRLFILFSHFPASSMFGGVPNPRRPGERRVNGPEVQELLWRFPNVVAWVNGHHHVNAITPRPDPAGRTGGYWDINTASHIDHPQHARVVELVDNCDGTLSIWCTMLEHLAEPAVAYDDRSLAALASLSREMAANDPQSDRAVRLGTTNDLNVELVIRAPFEMAGRCAGGVTSTTSVSSVPSPSTTAGRQAGGNPGTPANAVSRPARYTG